MRQLVLSPRWIGWHLLTLGAMVTCGWLAAWQWQRAGSSMGSALNVGYGLQWPVFAVFFGLMWWRMLRMEAAQLRGEGAETEAHPAPVEAAPAHPASADPAPSDPASGRPTPADAVPPATRTAEPRPATTAGPSPFGPRPAASAPSTVSDEDDPELAAYNRMLAQLAARHPDD